ncbi:MAG: protein-L-isoaspartate(D-aspartate) O-methyltransferase [Chloroflexota bacterium]
MSAFTEEQIERRREEREALCKSLRSKGIWHTRTLRAIESVPRELFLEEEMKPHAYVDNALPIDCRQTISQPFTVAYMTQLLNVKEGEKALEIGTGSGYQAAVLSALGAKVYSVERFERLYKKTSEFLKSFGLDVEVKLGDGTLGWEENAPYDKIIVTAAAPGPPPSLFRQLKIGGRMVIPIGGKKIQRMHALNKISETHYRAEKYDSFKFVPLVGEEGWHEDEL